MTDAPLPVATDPQATVHTLASRSLTHCGQDATFWSHAVTPAIEAGLVVWCDQCEAVLGVR